MKGQLEKLLSQLLPALLSLTALLGTTHITALLPSTPIMRLNLGMGFAPMHLLQQKCQITTLVPAGLQLGPESCWEPSLCSEPCANISREASNGVWYSRLTAALLAVIFITRIARPYFIVPGSRHEPQTSAVTAKQCSTEKKCFSWLGMLITTTGLALKVLCYS